MKKYLDRIISLLDCMYFNRSKYYFTFWRRPKNADDIFLLSPSANENKISIVIQGKVIEKDDFTFETIKLYRKKYPQITVVLSTWDDTPTHIITKIGSLGCSVVLSSIPTPLTGYCNNNLQRISSCNGIEKAIELGSDYILKTRTDQRFYSDNIFNYLIALLKKFPVRKDSLASERIVVTSLGTFGSPRLYNISDMFNFGKSEDILRYYSCPPDNSDHNRKYIFRNDREFSKFRPGEIYFSTHYLEAIGHKLLWTDEDSNLCMKDYFIIIDEQMIDLYWLKYSKTEHKWRVYSPFPLNKICFKDWFCMQVD